jgi:hypothetical protein
MPKARLTRSTAIIPTRPDNRSPQRTGASDLITLASHAVPMPTNAHASPMRLPGGFMTASSSRVSKKVLVAVLDEVLAIAAEVEAMMGEHSEGLPRSEV